MKKETTENSDPESDDNVYEGETEATETPITTDMGRDLRIIPNDFNVETIISFMSKGVIKIPAFQRHFQWDIKRSSSFIETILLGFPVPSIFLYEINDHTQNKGRFRILDGHQRLLSLYFFVKNRYPKNLDAREKLRQHMILKGANMQELLEGDDLFKEFKLNLPENTYIKDGQKLPDLNFNIMNENLKENFQLTPFRVTTIKESGGDTGAISMDEIYTRLNIGGQTLNAQQIRAARYDSFLYEKIYQLNYHSEWRDILKQKSVSIKMKDVETILRTIALLVKFESHGGSMKKFLDIFSDKFSSKEKKIEIELLEKIYLKFFEIAKGINFLREETGRFSVPAYESIFLFACLPAWKAGDPEKVIKIEKEKVKKFLNNSKLKELLQEGTTSSTNIKNRLELAKKILN